MNPFVLNTIVNKCWNATAQYRTTSVRPARVSKTGGSIFASRVAGRSVAPPAINVLEPFFNYYQIGDIEPALFGVNVFIKDAWVSCEKLMTDNEIFINVSLENGAMISPKDCWFKKAGVDRNWILAVFVNPVYNYGSIGFGLRQEDFDNLILDEDGSPIPLLGYDQIKDTLDGSRLTVHFYTNEAFFNSSGRLGHGKIISYMAKNPSNVSQVLSFLNSYNDDIYTGWVLYNGMVSTLAYAKNNAANLAQKEIAVYVDQTIVKKVWFNLSTTPFHYLEMGSGLTLRLGETGFYNVDDVSLFVGTGVGSNFLGVNLNVDLTKYAYQLSELEIGLDTSVIGKVRTKFPELSDLSNLYIYAVVRKSVEKSYGLNTARLDLLQSLSITERNKIFNGVYPTLSYWRGDHLKNHPFLQLVQSKIERVTDVDIIEGFGYSGINRLLNPYPTIAEVTQLNGFTIQTFKPGPALKETTLPRYIDFKIEVMVYDYSGKLVRSQFFDRDYAGYFSFRDLPQTKCAELTLTRGFTPVIKYFPKLEGNVILPPEAMVFGFGCYVATNLMVGDWQVATAGVHYNLIEMNGERSIHWDDTLLQGAGLLGRTVFGGDHYHSIIEAGSVQQSGRDFISVDIGLDVDGYLGISPATVEFYLSGSLLIEGIDYIISDDKVYIFKPVVFADTIRARLCGLSPTGQAIEPIDVGFTDEGRIGLGSKVRQMSYKQCQFNVGGAIRLPSEIILGGSSSTNPSIGTGVPYAVKQRVASIEHYLDYSSVDAMTDEDNVAMVLYDALQDIYPISSSRVINSILEELKYEVISCLINELIFQVKAGWHYGEIFAESYTLAMVDTWLDDFMILRTIDITLQSTFDSRFMTAIPYIGNNQTLSQQQINFLHFVNDHFLNSQVDLVDRFEIG